MTAYSRCIYLQQFTSQISTTCIKQESSVQNHFEYSLSLYEPRCEKTGLRGFRPGLTQTELYKH